MDRVAFDFCSWFGKKIIEIVKDTLVLDTKSNRPGHRSSVTLGDRMMCAIVPLALLRALIPIQAAYCLATSQSKCVFKCKIAPQNTDI